MISTQLKILIYLFKYKQILIKSKDYVFNIFALFKCSSSNRNIDIGILLPPHNWCYSTMNTTSTVWCSIPQYKSLKDSSTKAWETTKDAFTHTHTLRHTQTLNDDNVWHFWHYQLVSGEEERGGDESRRERKRSLMIKLSPDLVFDRGRSHSAITQRLLMYANTHSKWQDQL